MPGFNPELHVPVLQKTSNPPVEANGELDSLPDKNNKGSIRQIGGF